MAGVGVAFFRQFSTTAFTVRGGVEESQLFLTPSTVYVIPDPAVGKGALFTQLFLLYRVTLKIWLWSMLVTKFVTSFWEVRCHKNGSMFV